MGKNYNNKCHVIGMVYTHHILHANNKEIVKDCTVCIVPVA